MPIEADSHTEAAAFIVDLLTKAGVPNVYAPPVPTRVFHTPAVRVLTPTVQTVRPLAGPGKDHASYSFGLEILIVAADTDGTQLLELTDQVSRAVAVAGLNLTTETRTYQPADASPLPAMLVTPT